MAAPFMSCSLRVLDVSSPGEARVFVDSLTAQNTLWFLDVVSNGHVTHVLTAEHTHTHKHIEL